MSTLAIDTECTGLNFHKGVRPFFVSTCDDEGNQKWWEFPVDPYTREVDVPNTFVPEFLLYIRKYDYLVFHNATFDVHALETIGISADRLLPRAEDTMIASHVLNSWDPHSLSFLTKNYLGQEDSEEKELKDEVRKARRVGKTKNYLIGKKVQEDYWLPRVLNSRNDVLTRYALRDAERTMELWLLFKDELKEQDLWDIYVNARRLLPVIHHMQNSGVNLRMDALDKTEKKLKVDCKCLNVLMLYFTDKKKLNLQSSKQLQELFYTSWKLPTFEYTPTGFSTSKTTIEKLRDYCKDCRYSGHLSFFNRFLEYKEKLTLLRYIKNYKEHTVDGKLYPSFNPTGTATTRFSSSNPNAQNIGKGDEDNPKAISLRSLFGPPEGKVWLALDYQQLQLRIFAWMSNEPALIRSFQEGYDFHNFVACKLFKVISPSKKQRTIAKNINFGIIFGAGEAKIDATAGMVGAFNLFRKQFPNVTTYMREVSAQVRANGYIHTRGGYKLIVPAEKPYVGVNFIVQGTEGEIVKNAMVSCFEFTEHVKRTNLILQVHDELIFELDKSINCLLFAQHLKAIMEYQGEKLGIETPVSCDLITSSWDKAEKLDI